MTLSDVLLGGDLQIPEESVQSEHAGERMGAGILECDVSFTHDRGLVCRHSVSRKIKRSPFKHTVHLLTCRLLAL